VNSGTVIGLSVSVTGSGLVMSGTYPVAMLEPFNTGLVLYHNFTSVTFRQCQIGIEDISFVRQLGYLWKVA
jgi:hypothetical protein